MPKDRLDRIEDILDRGGKRLDALLYSPTRQDDEDTQLKGIRFRPKVW